MFVFGVNEFLCVVMWIMCSKWSDMVVCILSNFFLEQEFMCGKWSQFYNNYSVFIVTLFVKWAHDLEHHLWIGEFYDSLIGFKCSKIAGWLHKIKIHGCFSHFLLLFISLSSFKLFLKLLSLNQNGNKWCDSFFLLWRWRINM